MPTSPATSLGRSHSMWAKHLSAGTREKISLVVTDARLPFCFFHVACSSLSSPITTDSCNPMSNKERILQLIQRAASEEELNRILLSIPLCTGVVSYYAADSTLQIPETWPCGESCVKLALQRMLGRPSRGARLKSARNLVCCARILESAKLLDPRNIL